MWLVRSGRRIKGPKNRLTELSRIVLKAVVLAKDVSVTNCSPKVSNHGIRDGVRQDEMTETRLGAI
jgi:hypothetical protein